MAKSKLDTTLEEIKKRYGVGAVLLGDETVKVERQKTGSLGLDIITGGGYGKGRFVEFVAPESSGKTTVCIHAMVTAQKDNPNKKVAFIDAEHAFDRFYAEALGLDMSSVIFCQPDNGEQALDILDSLIKSGEISLAVVDSIAALTPKSEIEGEMGESKIGLHARLMSQACRKLTAETGRTKTIVLWTNQIRDKIGVMYGSPEVSTGGNAMKFYSSIRIDLRKKQGNKDDSGALVDNKVTAKTIKNKLAPPYQKTEFDIVFGKGIDRESEIVSIGTEIGLIQKSGSWFSYGDTKLGQGAANVKELLRDNPELSDKLEKKIRTYFGI